MLGARIAALRTSLGWSQAELARKLNISPSAVGMYEQGRREPSVDMLVAIAAALGVSIEFLLTGKSVSGVEQEGKKPKESKSAGVRSLVESLKFLSRDELLVLLTAEIFGSQDG